ncbi:hypothetical protein [Alkalimonas mucilaginosa]|uniref:Uncharacterized protein n=1 Tax=Alkalimonas mucilaginosa TaxID=3057676 RepID=A0ABU7JDB7_9GAMM|nr:hypothetical protein [Alkalimonas sp. MEB004]MEE2023602.1 hypothetical protein [Alkalimonas sp. MEB004]
MNIQHAAPVDTTNNEIPKLQRIQVDMHTVAQFNAIMNNTKAGPAPRIWQVTAFMQAFQLHPHPIWQAVLAPAAHRAKRNAAKFSKPFMVNALFNITSRCQIRLKEACTMQ